MEGQINPRDGFRQRLERAAEDVDALRAALSDAIELRDLAILDAVDAGVNHSEAARWARVGRTRVLQVVETQTRRAQAEAELPAAV